MSIKLPKYSDTAHCAAILTESPVAIIITMNRKKSTWEARVYGENNAFSYLAGLAADAALPAVNDMVFPADTERMISLLNSLPMEKG